MVLLEGMSLSRSGFLRSGVIWACLKRGGLEEQYLERQIGKGYNNFGEYGTGCDNGENLEEAPMRLRT